jgi:hypothetical protein
MIYWLIGLIAHAMPEPIGEAWAGDLMERFGGSHQALVRELLFSTPTLLLLCLRGPGRQGSWAIATAVAAMLASDRLWNFVLIQVPRRAPGDRPLVFWLIEAAIGLAGVALVLRVGRSRKQV